MLASSSDDGIFLWDTATRTYTQAPKLEGEVTKLSFSKDGKFLLTNLGRLSLDDGSVSPLPPTKRPASPSVPLKRLAFERPAIDGLRYDGEWVSQEGENLLYIPAGQRPADPWRTWRMFKNILSIGDASGQVTRYKFKFLSS